ncbi:ABC transporter permease [Caldiplasma sukawensis]
MTNKISLLSQTFVYYFRNYYRSRSFYLMLILSFIVSILLTYLSFKYSSKIPTFAKAGGITLVGTTAYERVLAWLWNFILSYLPVFAAVFFGSPAISSEIETKTAFHVFTLPIPRYILLIGKYFASVLATILIAVVYTVFELAVFQYIYGFLVIGFLYAFLLTVLFIIAISAFTFLVSSIFNKNTYAYIVVLITYVLVFNAAEIVIELLYKVKPFYLLNYAETAIERVFVNLQFGITTTSNSPFPASFHTEITAALVMLIYAIVSIGAATILFERKEVK